MATVRHATNLSMDTELVAELRSYNINISQVCENHLRSYLHEVKAQRWLEEHADFIAGYNAVLERDGPPLAEFRSF